MVGVVLEMLEALPLLFLVLVEQVFGCLGHENKIMFNQFNLT